MMDKLAVTLLVNTVVFSALFGLMLLVRRFLGKRLSPALLLMLWAIVILKLFIPFGFESSIGIFPARYATNETAQTFDLQTGLSGHVSGASVQLDTMPITQTNQSGNGQTYQSPSGNTDNTVNTQQTTEETAINWTTVGLCVWAAGVLAALAVFHLSAANLRKRILHTRIGLPENVPQAFEECRRILGIRREIDLCVQSALGSPVMMGVVKPVLVLPADVTQLDHKTLNHIFLHELTHLQRKDIWAMKIMNLLCALYWFNPLVWFCFKTVCADIETACDHYVIKVLGKAERLSYIGTVLQYAGRMQTGNRPVAAMGLSDGQPVMEKRISAMYKVSRTGIKGRIFAGCIALMMLLTCALTACQPTPGKAIVQSKNNDSVENAITNNAPDQMQPAAIHKYSAPETWKSETHDESKKINIAVDAKVTVPTDIWGLYQLIPGETDKSFLDMILKALIGDAEIYGEDTYKTRGELEKDLIQIKMEITQMKKMDQDLQKKGGQQTPENGEPSSTGEVSEADKAGQWHLDLEQRLHKVEEALANAPEDKTVTKVPIDTDILFADAQGLKAAADKNTVNTEALEFGTPSVSIHPDTGLVELHGLADIGRKEPVKIFLSAWKGNFGDIRFQIDCGGNGGFGSREPLGSKPLAGIAISQEEAAQIARKTVKDMGFDYLDITAVQKMGIYDQTRPKGDQDRDCYAFTFTRSLDGVPSTYAYWSGGVTKEEWDEYEKQYAASWKITEVLVGVDDSGVVLAEVNVPKSDVKQLAQGIELKNFNEIMEIFNQQAVIEGCYSPFGNQEKILGRKVHISEIRLGYMTTIWKDHPDQIIFVPVWDFFGEEITTFDPNVPKSEKGDLYEALDENSQFHYNYDAQAFLTINALDGTIMKRQPGPD